MSPKGHSTKRAVRNAVSKLLARAGIREAPVDLCRVARVQGVLRIEDADLGNVDACIIPCEGGFAIKVNRDAPERRRRFSLAHEIGHTLLKDAPTGCKYRHLTTRANVRRPANHRREERICDFAAAEILMPESLFRPWLAGRAMSIRAIEAAATHFEVSRQAAAIRLAESSEAPAEVVCWKPRGSVLEAAWFSGFRHFSQYASQDEMSRAFTDLESAPVRALWSSRTAISNDEPVRAEGRGPKFYCESKAFGTGEHRYVLSVIKERLTPKQFEGLMTVMAHRLGG